MKRKILRGIDVKHECQWFAHCTNPVTRTALHPDFGEIPICESCARIIEIANRLVETSDGSIRPHETRAAA
jgi:hypothetical protein